MRLHSPSQTFEKRPYREDNSSEDRVTIHRSSQAGENLSLPRGGPLKLDASRPLKRKLSSPSIDRDVSFTDLGYTASQSAIMDIPEEWDDSDEDMPETIIPLAKGKENGRRYSVEVHV
jgi:hypothetical protein